MTKSKTKTKTKTQHLRKLRGKKKTRKNKKGGKAFGLDVPVMLQIKGDSGTTYPVLCDVCKNNNYIETPGTLNKSKVRSGIGQFLLGDLAEDLDTTSIIAYFCNICGKCIIIRNREPLRIIATPVPPLPPAP